MIAADDFYTDLSNAPRQGDILLTGVSRMLAADGFSPPQWKPLDQHLVEIQAAGLDRDLTAAVGIGLAMLTSHDCQMDKEWNRRVHELIKEGRSPEDAEREAEEDSALDRSLLVSPLVSPDDLGVDRGHLMGGRIIGYLPVPASADGLIPEAVVDLTYRCTTDRLDVVKVASVSTLVRARLRYALIQLDALRAADLGFEVEKVTGRRISRVEIPVSSPMMVRVHLDDGTSIELLQQPAEPRDGPGRTGSSLGSGE